MTTIKTTIINIVVIFFTFNIVLAQSTTTNHRVEKGDNIYRLSLRYGVSMESIFDLNPGSRKIIKIGELIAIPTKGQNASKVRNSNSNNSQFKDYIVSKGETKYGLSKKFNISIAALEKANPSIVKMLMTGQKIQVPSKSNTEKTLTDTTSETISHVVKKGENLWRISEKYNMTLSELRALNKDIIDEFLQIGQELTIRKDTVEEISNTYLVAKGDTKFSLAKRFNLSIKELENLNPETIPILKYNTRIKTGFSEPKAKEPVVKTTDSIEEYRKVHYEDYTIQPKETLYGLAKRANMTIEDLQELNPSLKVSVIEGSRIKMPANSSITTTEISSNKEELNPNTTSTSENKAMAISVFWDEKKISDDNTLQDQKSDYYIGLQNAIDSIGKVYPNKYVHIENDLANRTDLQVQSETPTMSLFPIESSEIDHMSLRYEDQGNISELKIKGLPTEDDIRNSVLTYLSEQDGNFICLYDDDHAQHKNSIEKSLSHVTFIPTNKNGTYQSNKLSNALRSDIKNFVIIESNNVGVFLSSTNLLLRKMSESNIQLVVLNSNNIPSDGSVTGKRFKVLKLLYPQEYNPELSNGLNKATAFGFAFNYDILRRLLTTGLDSFDSNETTSVFGFSFHYDLKEGIYKNKSVSILVFDENSISD